MNNFREYILSEEEELLQESLTNEKEKNRRSEELKKEIDDFLAKGGKITKLKPSKKKTKYTQKHYKIHGG